MLYTCVSKLLFTYSGCYAILRTYIFPILQSAGVQFPQRPHAIQSSNPTPQANKKDLPNGELPSSWIEEVTRQEEPQIVPESRYHLLTIFIDVFCLTLCSIHCIYGPGNYVFVVHFELLVIPSL